MNCHDPLQVVDLGSLAYLPALERQRQVNEQVASGQSPMTLLLVEHPPVITVTHRRHAMDNLITTPSQLEELGIALQETDRGGDITYHGPGQLVAYPILRLNDLGLNLGSYMRLLERIVIDTLAAFHIHGRCEAGATGVWVKMNDAQQCKLAKICAMGVRVRKNTTMHGLAINVCPEMSHFQTIIPCGLKDSLVISMQQLLGDQCPEMDQVKQTLVSQFHHVIQKKPGAT